MERNITVTGWSKEHKQMAKNKDMIPSIAQGECETGYIVVEGPHGWIVQGEWPSICAAYRDFKTTETKITRDDVDEDAEEFIRLRDGLIEDNG